MRFKIGLLFLVFFMCGNAQESNISEKEIPYQSNIIQWISQYPIPGKQKESSSFFDFFSNLVFGKKNTLEITKPVAILAKSPISYFILDQGSSTIFHVQDNKKKIPKILKNKKLDFPSLVNLCSFTNNRILFTDSRLNKIFILNEKGDKIEVLNQNLTLKQPTGIAYSPISKKIWVVETGDHRISILNEQGKRIKTIGHRGSKPGEFNYPTAIWIGNNGNAYIIDAMNFRIQIFDTKGNLISLFGSAGDASGYFARPKGIATDSFGNIYVSDALFRTVQIFDISGNFLYNFGDQGRENGQFWMPSGIFIDENNFIYVADAYNSRVQLFQLLKEE